MKFGLPIRVLAALTVLAGTGVTAFAQTTATFSSAFTNPQTNNSVSAQATFTVLGGGVLQIDITDLSNPFSFNRGDLMGAVMFNFANSVTVSAANGTGNITTSLLSGATVVTSNPAATAASQAVDGSWVFGTQPTDPDNTWKYGVAGAGMSNPGFTAGNADGKQVYGFSGFGLGGGGDDYLMIPSTADASTNSNKYLNGGSVNLIKGSIRVQVSGLTGLTSTSQITSVGFLFASGANPTTGTYNTQITTPEPGTFGLFSTILPVAVVAIFRRRKIAE